MEMRTIARELCNLLMETCDLIGHRDDAWAEGEIRAVDVYDALQAAGREQ